MTSYQRKGRKLKKNIHKKKDLRAKWISEWTLYSDDGSFKKRHFLNFFLCDKFYQT